MPVVVASIRHRRGLRSELPASLEEGELGLTLDTGELFIGTPSFPPATTRTVFPWQNTQILTEWSPNSEELIRAILRDRDVAFDPTDPLRGLYPVPDGADPDTQTVRTPELIWRNGSTYGRFRVSRRLQEVVDEVVSVRAYGARGDGRRNPPSANSADLRFAETQALRVAILDAANTRADRNTPSGWKRRALHFPAGVYEILGPLPLPPGACWIGEGPDNTVIVLDRESDPTVGFDDCVLFTIDGGLTSSDYLSTADVNPTGLDALLASHAYSSMDPASLPEDIVVEGIRFVVRGRGPSSIPHDVARIVRARRVVFRDCVFEGDYAGGKSLGLNYDPNTDGIAVVLDGAGSAEGCREIRFESCRFTDSTYGLLVVDDVDSVDIDSCSFERLFRGISLYENVGVTPGNGIKGINVGTDGPRRFRVEGCRFDDVEGEGIQVFGTGVLDRSTNVFYEEPHGLISISNRFGNVGNGNFAAAVDSNAAWCVYFDDSAPWCASIADLFARNQSREATGTQIRRIRAEIGGVHAVLGLQDPPVRPGGTVLLPAGTTSLTPTGIRSFVGIEAGVLIRYRISDPTMGGGLIRAGTLRAVTDGTDIAWSDVYDWKGPSDYIRLEPVLTGGGTMLEVHFTNNDPSLSAQLSWTLEYLNF